MNRSRHLQIPISDEGSDLAKAIRIFIEAHPGIAHIHDISHKISNILKSEFDNELNFKEFSELVTDIKQKIKNGIIAYLCPPKFRKKVRFLNIRDPIRWAFEMLNTDIKKFAENEKEHFIACIKKPLEKYQNEINFWYEVTSFTNEIETEIKHNGLKRRGEGIMSTSEILINKLHKLKTSENAMRIFNRILEFIKIQEAKLSPGQTIIGSSDIIESIFGKWKRMCLEDSMAGITDKILL